MSVDRPEMKSESGFGGEGKFEDVRGKGAQVATQARERLGGIYEDVKERVGLQGKSMEDIREDVTDYIRESPGRALLIALGIGFALGIITRR